MGMHFGELAFIRGVVYYRLSPHELKPLAGAITRGLPNLIPRTSATVFTWLPTFIIGYTIFQTVEHQYYHFKRKNVADYDNEIDPNPCKPRADDPTVCE